MVRTAWSVVERGAEWVLIALFAAMTITCAMQVLVRYVINVPLVWSEELARYLFIWIGYLSAWLAWRHRSHIALDAVNFLDGATVRRWSKLLVEALVLAYCLYTLVAGLQIVAITHMQPSAVLELPMSVVYAGYNVMVLLIGFDIVVNWISPAPTPDLESGH